MIKGNAAGFVASFSRRLVFLNAAGHHRTDGLPKLMIEFLAGTQTKPDLSLIYPVDPKQLPKEMAGVKWPPEP